MADIVADPQIHGYPLSGAMWRFAAQLNAWGREGRPFLFLVDFEGAQPRCFPLDQLPPGVAYAFGNATPRISRHISITANPEPYTRYLSRFNQVMAHLQAGDSYLVNLTLRTPISFEGDLNTVFESARAPYKLLMPEEFVVFSPEAFVRMEAGWITTFPMKGTQDAGEPFAADKLLTNPKEFAEHVTTVDLLRNDLSRVAAEVTVERFRYLETIVAQNKSLLQASSAIRGRLARNYTKHLGSLLVSLLPAGSICGAPKIRTCEIIREAEGEPRGYYTGVAGIFDGQVLDSFVMIRFIEQRGDSYFYRSGGGITAQSHPAEEYQEVLDKIYVPVN